ncbi:ABC transporter permease [Oceanibacterium hippocampi]|uniref:High-affinity branched-chain amino acid transport system permease protein LivH n=1 Tax=Oceanibacterium hippocampi TaxID=745714 RepID=A0A1Y5SEA0_9PROT|nr:ABC transporter permease [Oceanibacterium hippocampi]SLN38750.1 High-affinity branched-chain amino acid transport system permease protein LivH [Oceanibacterium hippocampi]
MSFFVVQFLTGLASAASLFLVACGLSIIFGVTRIVNFAHGSFYMLGAYLAATIVATLPVGIFSYWGSVLVAALVVGLIGIVVEIVVLRRIYHAPELFQLVATFGVVLVVQDLTLAIWGPADKLGPLAPGLDSAVNIGGQLLPEYDVALIILGPAVLGLLWLLFHRTRWGTLVRAATQDREMVGALGVNQRRIFTSVFFLGACLAGLGGAVQIPREPISLMMDLNVIAEVFVVVVIGGMGSILGAFLAAVIIGELNAFGILIFPEITLVLLFLVMAVVLVIRPRGLLGKPELTVGAQPAQIAAIHLPGPATKLAMGVLFAVLALVPLFAGDFLLVLLIEVMLLALFAASLHFIMGNGGMVSFGHAAYFGIGAYGAALAVVHSDSPMELALVLAPTAAGLAGLVFGWFCVRLSGVYFAMLSLAFAQIAWSVVFQWYEVTGGDDGLLGIWPSEWASDRFAFYYLSLIIVAGGVLMLRRMIFSPFGYALRAGRDSPLRSDAIGINLRHQQWASIVIAGAFAGLAGGLYAFSKGSVFPDAMSIPRSVDALVMVLLGGVDTLAGPLVGAAALIGLEDAISRFDYWRLILGLVIILICVTAPNGIVGSLKLAFAGRRERE